MIPPLSEEGIHCLCITLLRLLKNGNQRHKTLKNSLQEYRFKPKRSSVTGTNGRGMDNGRYGQVWTKMDIMDIMDKNLID
jgi:hypothetical protein